MPGEDPGNARTPGLKEDVPLNDDGTRAADAKVTIMNKAELLVPARALCQQDIASKKRALEILSELIAESDEELIARDIFNCLVAREKLGSTGLGHGVAIPHGRMPEIGSAVAAAITLKAGVDFDAPDGEPVDLVVGLIVPEESTDEHLHILARLAQAFSDSDAVRSVREAPSPEQLSKLLSGFLEKT